MSATAARGVALLSHLVPDRYTLHVTAPDAARGVVLAGTGPETSRTGSATVFQASLNFGFFRRWLRRMMSLRMRAMRASFLALPSATRRS